MNTALLFLCLFVLHSLNVFSQTSTKELIIAVEYYDTNVYVVAAKYSNDSIWIDNKFDFEKMEFNPRISIHADHYPAIKEINRLSIEEILETKKLIDSTNCDYYNPIYIIYREGAQLNKVNWNRIANCYPEKIRFIEELDRQIMTLSDKYAPN